MVKECVLLLLLSLLSLLASAQISSFCDENDYMLDGDDPPLPDLADQFYYSLEATLVERQRSFFISEYLDEFGNRGRLDFTIGGTKLTALSDYNLAEAFVFPNIRTGEECSVNLLTTNRTAPTTQFFFGIVQYDNGSVHIGAPSFGFYNSINRSNVNYLGLNESRGIPAHHWQACVSGENNSFTMDYYFTSNDLWTNSYGTVDGHIPVTIELRGQRLNTTDGSTINIEHYYSFVDYNTGSEAVPDEVFMVPTGLICSGRIPGNPLPPLPDYFSTDLEISATADSNSVQNFREYYDLPYQLFRIDGFSENFGGSFVYIQDFNVDVAYSVHPEMASPCKALPLIQNSNAFSGDVDEDGHLRLRSAQALFYAQDFRGFVYEGVTTIRGIDADAWISQNLSEVILGNRTYTENHYQLLFSRPGQVVNSLYGSSSDPVLLQTVYIGVETTRYSNGSTSVRNVSSITNLFGFSPIEPSLDVFDVTECFPEEDVVDVFMRLQMNLSSILSVNNFKQSIRGAITDYAKSIGMPFLTPLQVSSIRFRDSDDDDDQFTMIHVHITNVSSSALIKWKYTARDLVNRIVQNLNSGDRLPFTVRLNNMEVPLYYSSSRFSDEESESEGLASSTIAAISVATYVLGMLVGVVCTIVVYCLVQMCRQKKNSVNFSSGSGQEAAKYERQVNEPVDLPDVAEDTAPVNIDS